MTFPALYAYDLANQESLVILVYKYSMHIISFVILDLT